MSKIFNFFKSKKLVVILLIFVFLIFGGMWNLVSGGYDKQNKVTLFIKKFIPSKISRKVRDIVFIIPNLKERNKFLSTQVNKYEQGLEGQLFNEEVIISKKNKKKYLIKEFFLPFPRMDTRLGWGSTKNSQRAHHFAFVNEDVIVISGEGKTIYFNKNNILTNKLNQIEIVNNIDEILKKNNSELIGIRDLFVEDSKMFISLISKNSKGITIDAYRADINLEKLNFSIFFESNEYWKQYNVFSGGRFSTYKDNKILFTIGYSYEKKVSQQLDSLLGKIISIDKSTKEHKIISMGHRNPQGLFYIKKSNIIINTEHGPKGGDEININFQEDGKISNFGWDISSYGTEYSGPDPYKKSHAKYGFIEPLKYYTPAIGISQMVYMPRNLNYEKGEYLYVTSLRAGSVYIVKTDKNFNKVINEDRIFFNSKRIRDIMFDKENNVFFLIFEYTPSIGILKLKK
ncbi:MAG: Glucose/arabinose dehydrogenase, beta-propeller fold [Pelagibacterales bacterium]|nr:Glucose/arabinose dehydrogenase, beta-propeller fold [Pelagibacterales bacterium]